ncbi:putative haloacid dehalogenase-like hydrolase [Actinoplanes missouriensis 431]|uniref:Putative haloacid dehalogenase-like hydrolase n=1 Tax=Actinoplanes missouriensis (strain ATCC 14538 / DSM 43046 / CBS 188.64 / JCM 3121 / NBRC 102363 / NCIMB 12654 / NRRL B-3342 / UNCC 431) TaxID=512565 RepID=I0HGZ1_ACTM4|nr:HAD-IA family hydrolase [Actinoplanes missouriensis]BAL92278.1 putative haloacid dehalogenase-like hydrolase [Actinoplanes missouriensis 431]
MRDRARALFIDLDGVLRRWDPAPMIAVEVKYGLKPASLLETAMSWDIYRPAMAGEITDAEWMSLVATRLPLGDDESAAAVAEWQAYRGEVDPEALAFVREVRAAGRPVAIATNATDRLRGDLDALGLTGEVDLVISSWELKVHKPAPEFFTEACVLVGQLPRHVLMVDDDDRVIRGARSSGLSGYRWTGSEHVPYLRKVLDLPE